eukprot:evm.model.scf_1754.3 EVM.evm.TU.scf_1754.3   scf_1754:30618-33583(-)
MKRKGDPKAPKRVKISWDEGNLVENERIKAELAPTKIEEPKTPFHSPPRDEADDPFEEHQYDPEDAPEKADVDEAEGLPSEATERGHCSGTGESDAQLAMKQGNSAGASGNVTDSDLMRYWEENPGRINVSTGKEPAFADSRKQHYDMKEALRRGRELMEEDEDEEDGEENEAGMSQTDGPQAQTKCQ